jgi:23S rRNA (guanosine2251-2'-O)-methyltransferase
MKDALSSKIYIYGKHALMEALRHAPYAVDTVFLAEERKDTELKMLASKAGIKMSALDLHALPRGIDPRATHQGVIGLISPDKLMRTYRDFISGLTVTPDTALVILGEIHDPQNVGAIIRSAAAFGIMGVLIPEHNQAQISGSVVKVSAGMAFRIPLVTIGNVNTTIRDLKDRGFWIYGLAGDAPQSVAREKFDAPAVFILGNEGEGVRLKTRELCDILLSIPIHPRCESLNVAASAAVALYAWSAQHQHALENKG